MTFNEAFDKAKIKEPNDGNYIRMCKVLQESGASRQEIEKYFNSVMVAGEDYDKHEKSELIDYLVLLSTENPD